eukprot:m.30446 g.30446  ORF g.30446 m.30446 type:complete len:612 (+) comp8203_c0_seq2:165-2000(+)
MEIEKYPLKVIPLDTHVSCNNDVAVQWCRKGLSWMYAFHHEEAISCFKHALQSESTVCPLALWGISHCYAGNYNGSCVKECGPPDADKKYSAMAIAAMEKIEVTDVERGIITAEAARAQSLKSEAEKNCDFAKAMSHVYEKHRRNPDVAALFAEAIINQKPWSLYDFSNPKHPPHPPSDSFLFGTEQALTVIREGLKIDPKHPGLLHFLIHLCEMGNHESDGPIQGCLKECDDLYELAKDTDCGHLSHMPGHIYCLVGEWNKAVEVNMAAVLADERYVKLDVKKACSEFYTLYRCHDRHMLLYAAMFAGRFGDAMQQAANMEAEIVAIADEIPEAWENFGDFLDPFASMPFHVLIRFGHWETILHGDEYTPEKYAKMVSKSDGKEPVPKLLATLATAHYARGVAYSATKNTANARVEQSKFRELLHSEGMKSKMLFNNYSTNILAIADEMLEGEILYREGRHEEAFSALRRAVALNDGPAHVVHDMTRNAEGLVYDEPWGWMQPVRHALGALLMERGRTEEAEAVYREDLGLPPASHSDESLPYERIHCPHPNNVWALNGLLECLKTRSKLNASDALREEILSIERKLDKASNNSDTEIKASCACRLSAFQ